MPAAAVLTLPGPGACVWGEGRGKIRPIPSSGYERFVYGTIGYRENAGSSCVMKGGRWYILREYFYFGHCILKKCVKSLSSTFYR